MQKTTSSLDAMLGDMEPSGIHGLYWAGKHVRVVGKEPSSDGELVIAELRIKSYHDDANAQTVWVQIAPNRAESLPEEFFCMLRVNDCMDGVRLVDAELFGDGTVFVPLLTEKPV